MNGEQILQLTYNLSLIGALWATAFNSGLRLSLLETRNALTRLRLILKALALNLVLIPGLVWILSSTLQLEPGVALGLLLLAASAGGPYGLTASLLADADLAFALVLIPILQASRIIAVPVWLGVASPLGPSEIVQIIATLILYIVLPFAAGLVAQHLLPKHGPRWARTSVHLANLFSVIVIVSAVLLYAEILEKVVLSRVMALILVIQLSSLGLGYLIGGPGVAERRTVAVTAAVRSSATAIVIATQVYGELPLVAATVIVYGISVLVIVNIAARAMARHFPFPESESWAKRV